MPKNKNAKNAYSFFLADYRKQNPGLGGEINDFAFPHWQGLSAEEKARFERMAKDYKAKRKQTNAGRHDNQGNLLATRVDPRDEHMRRTAEEKNSIAVLVQNQEEVLDMSIYLIHFTTFCVTQQGQHLLAELGAVEYTLRKGIRRTFQVFFKPTEIPIGYRFTVQNQADTKLQIPLENFELATDNFKKVWDDLKDFFMPPRRNMGTMPPLFCLGEDRDLVATCLLTLGDLVGNIDASRLYTRVWSLEALVGELYLCRLDKPRSEQQIINQLTSSIWDDKQDARCAYHREKDGAKCALATCKKLCYAMSDLLAVVFHIELTPSHLPLDSAHPCAIVIEPSLPPASPAQTPHRRVTAPSRLDQGPSEGWHVDPNPLGRLDQDDVFYSDEEEEGVEQEQEDHHQPAVRLPKAPARSQTLCTGAMASQAADDWPSLQGLQAAPSTRPVFAAAQPPSGQVQGTELQGATAATPAPSASGSALHRDSAASLPRGRGSLLRTQTPTIPQPGMQVPVDVPMAGLGRGLVLEGSWPTLPATAPRVMGPPGVPTPSPAGVQPPPPSLRNPSGVVQSPMPPLQGPPVSGVPQQAGVGRGYLNGAPVPMRPVGRGAMPPELRARSAAGLPGAMRNLSFN